MNHEHERLDAVRRMLGAQDGAKIKISTGEIIRAWDIADGKGNVGIVEIEPETLLSCYAAVTLNKSLYSEENFEFREFPLRPEDYTNEFCDYAKKLVDYIEETMEKADEISDKYERYSLSGIGASQGQYRLGALRRAEPEILDAKNKVSEIAWYLNERAAAGIYCSHYINHGIPEMELFDVLAERSKNDALHLNWLLSDVREHIGASEKRILDSKEYGACAAAPEASAP